jgi:hypothetical protein
MDRESLLSQDDRTEFFFPDGASSEASLPHWTNCLLAGCYDFSSKLLCFCPVAKANAEEQRDLADEECIHGSEGGQPGNWQQRDLAAVQFVIIVPDQY